MANKTTKKESAKQGPDQASDEQEPDGVSWESVRCHGGEHGQQWRRIRQVQPAPEDGEDLFELQG